MRKVRTSKCKLMLIWVLPAILVPAVFLGTPRNADGASPNQLYACVNPSGNARIVSAKEKCPPSEKLVQWDVSGSQGDSGSQGGALTVVDSTGKTVGPLIDRDFVVLTLPTPTGGTDRLLARIEYNNFLNFYAVSIYYTDSNCEVTPLLPPEMVPILRVVFDSTGRATTGYYGGGTPGSYTPGSLLDYAGGIRRCWPISPATPRTLTPAKNVNNLNTLFTPPFSIK